ncbi:MAG: DUF2634 domain-containing protein [Eubacteriales bacterium]|nr:DUF2634 domain-containing protein [Eubacteriales bacterium]
MGDIYLGQDGNFEVAVDGDVETVRDTEYLVQDLQHQALTFPGDLWYDRAYGLGLQRFIKTEDTELTRLEIAQAIKAGFERDSRVEPESVRVEILAWELDKIRVHVRFRPNLGALDEPDGITESEASIIINIGQDGMSLGGEAV